MIGIITRVLLVAFTLLLVSEFVPGISVDDAYIAIIAAVILGLVNLIIKPIIFILTLPITLLSLGLFSFVINAALFYFVASFVDGFEVVGAIPALIGSFIVGAISAAASKLV